MKNIGIYILLMHFINNFSLTEILWAGDLSHGFVSGEDPCNFGPFDRLDYRPQRNPLEFGATFNIEIYLGGIKSECPCEINV